MECYLSDTINTIYNKRWDVWLIQNGYQLHYACLVVKGTEELNKLLYEAQTRAHQIKNSPLAKAMTFI